MVKNTKGGSSHKRLARKNEDEANDKKVDVDIDFQNCLIVHIDRNLGNCFTCRTLYTKNPSKDFFDKELKVLHQRGRNGRKAFEKTQSRIALVSLIQDFKLTNNCIGYVEELLDSTHINAYLRVNLINQDTYDKLSSLMNAKAAENVEGDIDTGFTFDRSNNVENETGKEEDVDVDAI
jgi:hypothetical protein